MQSIGQKIKQFRLSTGKTQSDFAQALACDQSTISQIENENLSPSLILVVRLVKKFGLTYEWLLEDKNEADAALSGSLPASSSGIAERISQLMKAEKLNSNSLAQRCGFAVGRTRLLLAGEADVMAAELVALLEAFPQYSANWLLLGKGQPKNDSDKEAIESLLAQNRELLAWLQQLGGKNAKLAVTKNH